MSERIKVNIMGASGSKLPTSPDPEITEMKEETPAPVIKETPEVDKDTVVINIDEENKDAVIIGDGSNRLLQ